MFKLEDLVQPALKKGQIYSILQKKHGRKVKSINLELGSLISYLSDCFMTLLDSSFTPYGFLTSRLRR